MTIWIRRRTSWNYWYIMPIKGPDSFVWMPSVFYGKKAVRPVHHDKTHEMIKVMKQVLDQYAPGTVLITETNVPHKENVAYFGDGTDEAGMVYQFPLPPMTALVCARLKAS